MNNTPWYEKGLRFACTACGKCCTGFPGYVWLKEKEAEAIASFLQLPIEEFHLKYTRKLKRGFSLKEMPKTYDCIFFKNHKCTIYSVRPFQCRSYPWWPSLIASEESWLEAGELCEGINHPLAPIVSCEEIQKILSLQLNDILI